MNKQITRKRFLEATTIGIVSFAVFAKLGIASQEVDLQHFKDRVKDYVFKIIGEEYEIDQDEISLTDDMYEFARYALKIGGYEDVRGKDGFFDSEFLPINVAIRIEEEIDVDIEPLFSGETFIVADVVRYVQEQLVS